MQADKGWGPHHCRLLDPLAQPAYTRRVRFFAPLAILVLAQAAAAAPHTVELRVSQGKIRFVKRIKVRLGRRARYSGPVKSKNGTQRRMIFSVLMTKDRQDGGFELQYQAELSGGRRSNKRSIQVQGSVLMRPGERVRVVHCGPWKVRLMLDPPKKGRKSRSNWRQGNYRITAKFGGRKSGMSCRQIMRSGSRGNVVYGIPRGRKRFGDIMNMMLMVTPSGVVAVQYQLEHSRPSWGKPTQMQGNRRLTLGKPDVSGGRRKRLELLVEGRPPELKGK